MEELNQTFSGENFKPFFSDSGYLCLIFSSLTNRYGNIYRYNGGLYAARVEGSPFFYRFSESVCSNGFVIIHSWVCSRNYSIMLSPSKFRSFYQPSINPSHIWRTTKLRSIRTNFMVNSFPGYVFRLPAGQIVYERMIWFLINCVNSERLISRLLVVRIGIFHRWSKANHHQYVNLFLWTLI